MPPIRLRSLAAPLVLAGTAAALAGCLGGSATPTRDTPSPTAQTPAAPPAAPPAATAAPTVPTAGDARASYFARLPGDSLRAQHVAMYRAARTAWEFVERQYQGSTGLARAHETYQFVTVWDVASLLASLQAARELGLTDEARYRARITRTLETLERLPLYMGVAYNKSYAAETGRMVDRDNRPSATGYGWSVLDLGRLLAVLHVIEQRDPEAAPQVRRIVGRLDLKRLVQDGYLYGEDLNPRTGRPQRYQEGRLGYEQYAAAGFEKWGVRATKALDFRANAKPVSVLGHTVFADARGGDLLTSEPFVMMGLELGWPTDDWRAQARAVLAAQEARYRQTGAVTMLSEDALPDPPAYFYYYLLHRDGRDFPVAAPGAEHSDRNPRWVSTKAAFGWHALLPSDYTWLAVNTVAPAAVRGRGWGTGVYERSHRATGSINLNSSALVLESAAVWLRGCPMAHTPCAGGADVAAIRRAAEGAPPARRATTSRRRG